MISKKEALGLAAILLMYVLLIKYYAIAPITHTINVLN